MAFHAQSVIKAIIGGNQLEYSPGSPICAPNWRAHAAQSSVANEGTLGLPAGKKVWLQCSPEFGNQCSSRGGGRLTHQPVELMRPPSNGG